MPSRTLPGFSPEEIKSHASTKSCFVTLGDNVYDLTDFLESHPGGGDLILEYAGRDVSEILKDESSHYHSEAAYEVLEDSLVGFVASGKPKNGKAVNGKPASTATKANGTATPIHPRTGMSCEEDLSRETDYAGDYKQNKFLDLSRPLFPQIWFGGFSKAFYLDQVHRPRHYKGGQSAPLFGNFLEPLTKTPWWIIPMLWLPPMAYGVYFASAGFSSSLFQALFWALGVFIWTLIEYLMHRFLFHLDE